MDEKQKQKKLNDEAITKVKALMKYGKEIWQILIRPYSINNQDNNNRITIPILKAAIAQLKTENPKLYRQDQIKFKNRNKKKMTFYHIWRKQKLINLTLAQAKAKAKECMKKKNAISTILMIAYLNSKKEKKWLGIADLKAVIKELKTENPELFKKYQTNLTNYSKQRKNQMLVYRKRINERNHNLTLEKENEKIGKTKTLIKTAIHKTYSTQAINNEDDSDQEITKYMGGYQPLNMSEIQALNQANQQIGTGSSHFQLQPVFFTPVIINCNTEMKLDCENKIKTVNEKKPAEWLIEKEMNQAITKKDENNNEFTKNQQLSDEVIVKNWINELNKDLPEVYNNEEVVSYDFSWHGHV